MQVTIKVRAKESKRLLYRLNEAKAKFNSILLNGLGKKQSFKAFYCPNPGDESGDWVIYIHKDESGKF